MTQTADKDLSVIRERGWAAVTPRGPAEIAKVSELDQHKNLSPVRGSTEKA